jgi:hypothetical protein
MFSPAGGTIFAAESPGLEAECRPLAIIENIQDWSTLSDSEFVLLYASHKPARCYDQEV